MNTAPSSFQLTRKAFIPFVFYWVMMLFVVVSIPNHLFGQPVSIQNEPAPVEYYRMPDMPLPPTYSTYSADIRVNFSDLSRTGYTESTLVDSYLELDGYKRVNKNGDVEITATIGEFMIWNEQRTTSRSKTKDKEGNEHVKFTFHIEVKYSLPMSLEVFNKEGNSLLDKYIFSNSDTRSWTSPSYNSMSDLDSYWRIQRMTRLADLQKDLMKEGLNKVTDLINTHFGYKLIHENARFETIGKKKHPDYERYQSNVEMVQSAFKGMKADKGLEEIKIKIEPALTFYHSQAQTYKTGNKDQEKLKHICLYNQALAYFWLEDFDQAETYAKAIQKFNSKDKDARRLLEDIDYTRSSLEQANRSSRHKIVVGSKT